jgi:signal transduction histidine kinase
MELGLQPVVALLAIAASVFSLITYLWLGLTVLLMGNRASKVTWVGGVGLLMAALFFLCHGALVGAGVPSGASPTDFWWHLSWVPGFAAPIFWAAIGLHYAGLGGALRRWRLPLLVGVAALGGLAAMLALLSWPAIGHYGDFIRVLGLSLRLHGPSTPDPAIPPALPALGAAFVVYVAACAFLPWASLAAVHRTDPIRHPSAIEATDSDADGMLLWDPADAWSRARRALLGASLCMIGAGAVVALVGVATTLGEHNSQRAGASAPLGLPVPPSPPGHVPLLIVGADLIVQLALAALGLLVGWAVVRQGVLVERRLPQRGFLSRWRGTAGVALLLAGVVASMAAVDPEALPDLLVLVTLVTGSYALFTWQSYGEHDRLLEQLRPFIASLAPGHAGWLATDPQDVEREVQALFTSLCRDVLGASHGRLSLMAGRLHRTLTYNAPSTGARDGAERREWTLPVMDERGVVARLALGPRLDGAGYTSADLEIARACGQRIIDAVGEFAAAQAVASLARRRGLEAELAAALPRRVLHDDILPRLHLSMLRLEALRGRVTRALPGAVAVTTRSKGSTTDAPVGVAEVPEGPEGPDASAELGAVVRELGHAHHDLATLMRATPAANPRRLEHGLVGVLRASLDGEFRGSFDSIAWDAPAGAVAAADALPAIVADLLLGATQEAIRNAGRHARGADLHRRLHLRVSLAADARWVSVAVSDDGVGLQNEAAREARTQHDSAAPDDSISDAALTAPDGASRGTRTGLLTHGALIGLVGGSLSVRSRPAAGTTVSIRVPRTTESPPATAP